MMGTEVYNETKPRKADIESSKNNQYKGKLILLVLNMAT